MQCYFKMDLQNLLFGGKKAFYPVLFSVDEQKHSYY